MKNLVGQAFGRLTVLRSTGERHNRSTIWECRCECGNVTKVVSWCLSNGNTRSCGCLARETTGKRRRTHGGSRTRTYASWVCMLNRCYNPTDKSFARYGGRGISVCDRWKNSYPDFLSDMGERPIGKTIDRFPNKNGNYELSNCRWANPIEQSNNRNRPARKRSCYCGQCPKCKDTLRAAARREKRRNAA